MQDEAVLRAIESKYRSLSVLMDERMRRQWAAAESRAYGWGGVRAVSDRNVAEHHSQGVGGIGGSRREPRCAGRVKAIPYGVYDLSENQGWVSVGIDHDTARFATEAIRR
jgi:hypothetical protein